MQLDGELINKNGHDYLIEVLDLPVYYGRNLDALYDCLTMLEEDIEIINASSVDKDVLDTFIDASEENDYLTLKVSGLWHIILFPYLFFIN